MKPIARVSVTVTVSVILKVSVIRSNETNFYTVSFKSDFKKRKRKEPNTFIALLPFITQNQTLSKRKEGEKRSNELQTFSDQEHTALLCRTVQQLTVILKLAIHRELLKENESSGPLRAACLR